MSKDSQAAPKRVLLVRCHHTVPLPAGQHGGRMTIDAERVGGVTIARDGVMYRVGDRLVLVPWSSVQHVEIEP